MITIWVDNQLVYDGPPTLVGYDGSTLTFPIDLWFGSRCRDVVVKKHNFNLYGNITILQGLCLTETRTNGYLYAYGPFGYENHHMLGEINRRPPKECVMITVEVDGRVVYRGPGTGVSYDGTTLTVPGVSDVDIPNPFGDVSVTTNDPGLPWCILRGDNLLIKRMGDDLTIVGLFTFRNLVWRSVLTEHPSPDAPLGTASEKVVFAREHKKIPYQWTDNEIDWSGASSILRRWGYPRPRSEDVIPTEALSKISEKFYELATDDLSPIREMFAGLAEAVRVMVPRCRTCGVVSCLDHGPRVRGEAMASALRYLIGRRDDPPAFAVGWVASVMNSAPNTPARRGFRDGWISARSAEIHVGPPVSTVPTDCPTVERYERLELD